MAGHTPIGPQGPVSLGRPGHRAVGTGDGLTGVIKRIKDLPPPPPIGTAQTGAGSVFDTQLDDRTADTGSVDAAPYVPIVLGRGRVVFSIPFNDSGSTGYGMFVCGVCEGPFDSYEQIWLNGNPMPGSGTHAAYLADPNNVHWYADFYPGDGSSSWGSKVPLKTCGHLVIWLFGDIWRPWQSVWVTHSSSLDVTIDFAGQVKGELCWDPRISAEVWTRNPALQFRLLHVKYKGVDPALMNDTEISAAADACDAAGFACDLTIASRELVDQAIADVLATCNGEQTGTGGQIGIILDQAQTGAAAFSFDEYESELMDAHTDWLSAEDRPTRVTVTFANSDANYKDDSVTVDDPGIALGTVQVNEKTIALKGVTTGTAAHAIALQTLNAATVLERTYLTIGWEGALLSRYTKIHVKTKGGLDDDYLVLEMNEKDPGFFDLVTKPYVAGVYGGTPITPPNPGGQHPPNPSTAPSAIRVTDASQTKQVLSSSDSTHDYYDVFQLVEYVLPSNADATIDHLAVRGSEASDSQTKVWADLVSSETTITPSGNETATDDQHRNLSATAIPVRRATRVITYSTRPTVLTDVTTENTTRLLVRSVNSNGDLSGAVTVDYTAGVGPGVTNPAGGGGAITSPLVLPPSGTGAGQGGEIQFRELAANGTNITGFVAPDSVPANLVYVLPGAAGIDGDVLVPDSTIGGYPSALKPLAWKTRGFRIEKPSGTIDGTNPSFTLSKTPSSSRILLISDGVPMNGGVDYGRVGAAITFRVGVNRPSISLLAAYPFGYLGDGGGTPEAVSGWTALEALGVCGGVVRVGSALYALGGETSAPAYKSPDLGATWAPMTIAAASFQCLVVDPATPSTLYVASWGSGVYKTTDSGATWVQHVLPGGYNCSAILVHPSTGVIYVGTEANGLFKSTDGGTTWSAVTTGDTFIRSIVIDPSSPSTVYAAAWNNGVIRSIDSGATWAARASSPINIQALAVDPSNGSVMYAATHHNGVYKSTDAGLTWTASNSGLTTLDTFALRIRPSAPSTLYVTTDGGGVFKSVDSGATWTAVNSGLTELHVYSLEIDETTTPPTIYAGTYVGVFGGIV